VCKNPRVDIDGPAVAELVASVAAAVSRRAAAVSDDVYEVILREIPELHDDKPVLALLASSVHSNIGTCLVFLQSGGSYKTTAERLMVHKNTVQYRIRKAEENLGRPMGENRNDVELALRASRWLGSSVLEAGAAPPA